MFGKDRDLTSLNSSTVGKIISRADRRKLYLFSVLRVLANGLDLVGIAGIAVLATAFGSFATFGNQNATVEIPVVGALVITEAEAVLIASSIALVFVLKSGFSLFLNFKTALFVAEIEAKLSSILAKDFFRLGQASQDEAVSVSQSQNIVMGSTGGIKGLLNSRILFHSEGSLLISLLAVFLVINPIATVALATFMGGVLVVLNKLININLKISGQEQISGSLQSLEALRDFHNVKREAHTAGVVNRWLSMFSDGRVRLAKAQALMYSLNAVPRYIVETSLILGILLFIGGVVVFSDIPSQAVTIGVFMGGGLRLMASVIPFQGAITGMRSGAATGQIAFDRLKKIFEEKLDERPSDSSSPGKISGSGLVFKDVYFSHNGNSESAIKGVSFEVLPKMKVAIVGPSGAGKSTIFDLAMGFRVPDAGEVRVGNQTSRHALTNNPGLFAIVPQRPHLISGTILENISLRADRDTDQGRVEEVLKRVGMGKLVDEQGWQKREIRPDTGQFSGGEIQRLSLARALYENPKILFLDEATSALDAQVELEISEVLQKIKKEMTVVMIAHRLSTVRGADKIIYLDKGQIIAEGTFQELQVGVKDFARAVEIMGLTSD